MLPYLSFFKEFNSENQTQEFLLLAFQNIHEGKFLLFFVLIVVYLAALLGNLLIITLVSTDGLLHSPMYFFLSHLSLSEIMFTTNIVPNMLHVILVEDGTISLSSCITQLYFFSSSTSAECLLLSVMSYDRFLAICSPLHYAAIMNQNLCQHLVVWCWLIGFMLSIIAAVLISKLQFCGSNTIDHFFCDLAPILKCSCSDTYILEMQDFILSFPVLILPFVFIILTYVRIIMAILRITSSNGRKKAFSTCSSHLTVVCTYYGTLIAVYMSPSTQDSFTANKVLSLLYTVVTPLLNPIIYSLRNQDIRNAMVKLSKRMRYQLGLRVVVEQ
ncbi:olfactory receptor 11L1-like [Rhinophrynus dorsalis]